MFGNKKRNKREPLLPPKPNVSPVNNPAKTNEPVKGSLVGPGTVPPAPRDETEEFLFGKTVTSEPQGSRFDTRVDTPAANPGAIKPEAPKPTPTVKPEAPKPAETAKPEAPKPAEAAKPEAPKAGEAVKPGPTASKPGDTGSSEAAKPGVTAPKPAPHAPKPSPVSAPVTTAPKPTPTAPKPTSTAKPEAPKPTPTAKPEAPEPADSPKAKNATESSALLFISDKPDRAARSMEIHTKGKPVYLIDMTKDKSGGKYVPDSAMRSFIGSSKLPGGGSANADYDIVDIVGLISSATPGENPYLVITGADHLVSRVYESFGRGSLVITMLAEKVNETIAEAEKAGVTIVVVTEEVTEEFSRFMSRVEAVEKTAGDKA